MTTRARGTASAAPAAMRSSRCAHRRRCGPRHPAISAPRDPRRLPRRPSGIVREAGAHVRRRRAGVDLGVAGRRRPVSSSAGCCARSTTRPPTRGAPAARARWWRTAAVGETITIASSPRRVPVADVAAPSASCPTSRPLQEVKAGTAMPRAWDRHGRRRRCDAPFTRELGRRIVHGLGRRAPARRSDDGIAVSPGGFASSRADAATVAWTLDAATTRPSCVRCTPRGATRRSRRRAGGSPPESADPRLGRWLDAALGDLDALRLGLPDHPDDEFLRGGRAVVLHAVRAGLAVGGTPRASRRRRAGGIHSSRARPAAGHPRRPADRRAARQDPARAAQRAGSRCPARASCCRRCTTAPSTRRRCGCACSPMRPTPGCRADEVRALVPALRGALAWITEYGDGSGHGFLDVHRSTPADGLANQGWKDSGDSIQWRDGTLAAGRSRCARCRAMRTRPRSGRRRCSTALRRAGRRCAARLGRRLRYRFRRAFWVTTPEGRYPAIALDADGRPVDTLTRNIGHLLGTGILDPDEEAGIARPAAWATRCLGLRRADACRRMPAATGR